MPPAVVAALPKTAVAFQSKVPKADDEHRLVVATCEKGTVEDVASMRRIKADLDATKQSAPNFVEIAATEVWKSRRPGSVADPVPPRAWTRAARARSEGMKRRQTARIGMPRVLNMYVYAPFFSGYFESLGIPGGNLVYSDFTTNEMYREGATRGAVDPCFPAKIGIAHLHNLLYAKHAKKRLDYIFFPMVDTLHTSLVGLQGSFACPTVTITPDTVRAAFIKESDVFAELGVEYVNPMVNFTDPKLLARQLGHAWGERFGLSEEENARAVEVGLRELHAWEQDIRRRSREALDALEREHRIGIVLLARAYHHDPGLNHEIPNEFQKLGYPVFSQSALPLDADLLDRLFGAEVRDGVIASPLAISDVWKNAFSAGTNVKLWAAKFAARHPNLVALELSSFKCGHDAPIYSAIESIVERSGTPYFSFKDIDENKPAGSIRIRVQTIHYFLKRHAEDLIAMRQRAAVDLDERLAAYERQLRDELLREQELAELALRQQQAAGRRRLLPVLTPSELAGLASGD